MFRIIYQKQAHWKLVGLVNSVVNFLSFISTSHDLFNLEVVSEAVDVNVDIKGDNLIAGAF